MERGFPAQNNDKIGERKHSLEVYIVEETHFFFHCVQRNYFHQHYSILTFLYTVKFHLEEIN